MQVFSEQKSRFHFLESFLGVPLPDQDEKSEAQKFGSKQEGESLKNCKLEKFIG